MSHHEGVSCDSCLKGNFRGKRYKCLVCFDYDLCATCFEAGATSTRHTTEHPMQCILTRSDFDLYYGGEALSVEQPQSFTCPFCGRMGLTEATLQEHVTSDHSDSSTEVVCPVCAALPGGEPNHVTDDFATHLTLEHRSPRELEEPQSAIRGRRAPHPSRGMNSARARRSQMQFSTSSGLSSLSPSNNRESMDPIAELLSQLSGVRRAANLGQSHSPQLQQLQMQLQLDRHSSPSLHQTFDRAPIERVIRRHQQQQQATQQSSQPSQSNSTSTVNGTQQLPYVVLMEPSPSPASLAAAAAAVAQTNGTGNSSSSATASKNALTSQFLLSRCNDSLFNENEQQQLEVQRIDRSLFVQELLLTTLSDALNIDDVPSNSSSESLHQTEHVNNSHLYCNENSEDQELCEMDKLMTDNDNQAIINCNENECPTNADLLNAPHQLNASPQQLQPHLLQYPSSLQRRQQKTRQNNSRSLGTTSTTTAGRTVNSRSTGANSPPTSVRRKVLRGQPNDPPPH